MRLLGGACELWGKNKKKKNDKKKRTEIKITYGKIQSGMRNYKYRNNGALYVCICENNVTSNVHRIINSSAKNVRTEIVSI